MNRAGLNVLVVEREPAVAATVEATLRRNGHTVECASTAEEALVRRIPDVLVSAVELDGMDGLDLLEALRRRGHGVRVVLVASLPNLDDCRRAMRLGAAEFLAKPLDRSELLQAVESPAPPAGRPPGSIRTSRDEHGFRLRRALRAVVEEAELAVRDLTAELVRWGLGPTARVRIATGAVELLDNAVRHAYPVRDEPSPAQPVEFEAECDGREVRLWVRDEGIGFDADEVVSNAVRDPIPGGLARAKALSERMEARSSPGHGSEVELHFSAVRGAYDDHGSIDLTELDWLTPGMCRRLLEILRTESGNGAFNLSPAVAVTLGRLLSGPAPSINGPATMRS